MMTLNLIGILSIIFAFVTPISLVCIAVCAYKIKKNTDVLVMQHKDENAL